MCLCAKLPEAIYFDSRPKDFEQGLLELGVGNWVKLFRCSGCGQLWRIDEWDKYQTQLAVKIPNMETWETFDSKPLEKALLLVSRGSLSEKTCLMTRCNQMAVNGVAYCLDHLYETGARQ